MTSVSELYDVLVAGLESLLWESPFGPEDFFGEGRQPAPTRFQPGTPEKVAELEMRYYRRELLFSKLDADREADEPCFLSEEAA